MINFVHQELDFSDKHLIFLVSQPRSGSTMLQHILGGHHEIHTLPEPWFMLNFVYMFRSKGLEAEYNAKYAYLAFEDFLKRIPNGQESYFEAIRRAAYFLYSKTIESSAKQYFLDKTPRYYFILPELYRFFPGAKFIILIRNPLAVFSSILETNLRGNWAKLFELADRKHDILTAPRLIMKAIQQQKKNTAIVKYEEIVANPRRAIGALCDKLHLPFDVKIIEYGGKLKFTDTTFIDPKSIYKHSKPVKNYSNEWINRLDTAQKVYIARNYLKFLGEEVINGLGYSYKELKDLLDNNSKLVFIPFAPFTLLIKDKEELCWYEKFWKFLTIFLQKISIRKYFSNFIKKYRDMNVKKNY